MRARINGIDLAYEVDGPADAPAIILNHTLASRGEMWRYQIAEFRSRYRVVTFDMRGHGDSGAPAIAYDFDMLADDVVGLMDHLRIAKATYVGISIGGMIGQALGLQHGNRFSGLVLASAPSRVAPESHPMWEQRIETVRKEGMESQVQPAIERWFSADFRASHPEVIDWIANMIRTTSVDGFVGCCRAIMNLNFTDGLAQIKLPTLVLAGELDPGTPLPAAELIAKTIPGARLEIVEGCLHQTAIEAPTRFNRAVASFLESLR